MCPLAAGSFLVVGACVLSAAQLGLPAAVLGVLPEGSALQPPLASLSHSLPVPTLECVWGRAGAGVTLLGVDSSRVLALRGRAARCPALFLKQGLWGPCPGSVAGAKMMHSGRPPANPSSMLGWTLPWTATRGG